ncbi:abortive infection bacteriophage resistance protein [Desulfobacter postgatei 2ac9]|uniref:Abortive infection bacteriophage resistance protein n=1 Tax=Desulfobacter postgatei 2ac9 TaxID=879212 RepID=I5B3Z2_9BACT|nr:abortive infection bacteriophage resistance protein [Desulfobacter postgatei 2ac9]
MRTPAGYLFLGEGVKYTKPPLTIDDQINLLTSRGMTIPDPARTARYLSHISYFRLRGYWIPFEKGDNGKDHHFKAGTSFDNVLDLYIFDRKFRLLILEAIERVEVSLRAHFANELGVCYGSHFYLDADYIHNTRIQSGLIDSLKAEIDRSTELFIDHYRKTYDDPAMPPIWAAAEVMSFGQLSLWFKNLKTRSDRNRVAKSYGIDEVILQSFMHHLTFIRNITAHHGRLWNRRMTITMKLPRTPRALSAMLNPKTERYIGNTAIMLGYFLKLISPGTSWPERMRKLIQDSPGIRPSAMGFNENWTDLPVWDTNKRE